MTSRLGFVYPSVDEILGICKEVSLVYRTRDVFCELL